MDDWFDSFWDRLRGEGEELRREEEEEEEDVDGDSTSNEIGEQSDYRNVF